MQSDDDRDRKPLEELKKIRTGRPTEDTELVLDKDKFRLAGFDARGGVDVVVNLFLANGEGH